MSDDMIQRDFDSLSTCPKCCGDDVGAYFRGPRKSWELNRPASECIERRCNRCHYVWFQATLEKREIDTILTPPQPEPDVWEEAYTDWMAAWGRPDPDGGWLSFDAPRDLLKRLRAIHDRETAKLREELERVKGEWDESNQDWEDVIYENLPDYREEDGGARFSPGETVEESAREIESLRAQLARFQSEEFEREVAEAVGAVILGGTWKTVSEPLIASAAAAVRKLLTEGGSDGR